MSASNLQRSNYRLQASDKLIKTSNGKPPKQKHIFVILFTPLSVICSRLLLSPAEYGMATWPSGAQMMYFTVAHGPPTSRHCPNSSAPAHMHCCCWTGRHTLLSFPAFRVVIFPSGNLISGAKFPDRKIPEISGNIDDSLRITMDQWDYARRWACAVKATFTNDHDNSHNNGPLTRLVCYIQKLMEVNKHLDIFYWRQPRRGCRGHIPSNILIGGRRQWEYPHQYYYVRSDIADH